MSEFLGLLGSGIILYIVFTAGMKYFELESSVSSGHRIVIEQKVYKCREVTNE